MGCGVGFSFDCLGGGFFFLWSEVNRSETNKALLQGVNHTGMPYCQNVVAAPRRFRYYNVYSFFLPKIK